MVLKNAKKSAITKDCIMLDDTKNTYQHADDTLPISNFMAQR